MGKWTHNFQMGLHRDTDMPTFGLKCPVKVFRVCSGQFLAQVEHTFVITACQTMDLTFWQSPSLASVLYTCPLPFAIVWPPPYTRSLVQVANHQDDLWLYLRKTLRMCLYSLDLNLESNLKSQPKLTNYRINILTGGHSKKQSKNPNSNTKMWVKY